MRRVHLRGRENILKRLVIHSGAANLGLLMRTLFGKGTPRSLQGRRYVSFSVLVRSRALFLDLAFLIRKFHQWIALTPTIQSISIAA
jgi:transposase